jgi:predicted phosphodiesterase
MMRVAVLSDIHSNAHALDAVRKPIAPTDRLWVPATSWRPHPDRVVRRLAAEGAIAVQGNHDAAVPGAS